MKYRWLNEFLDSPFGFCELTNQTISGVVILGVVMTSEVSLTKYRVSLTEE